LLKHEAIKKHLTFNGHYVIDYEMEFDKGVNPLFPEFKTRLAQFFNVDSNTCTGFMKFGDLDTGAIVTCHFKTMPVSANQYWYSDPYLVYDMTAEIVANGEYKVEHLIKADEVLKSRKIFVPLF
jgi:hypothetical protein